MSSVVLTWKDLHNLLEMFETQTREEHGPVRQPIHAWPALTELSKDPKEKEAVNKSLSANAQQYIAASLLIKEEQERTSSNREAAIRAVHGRRQKGARSSANQGVSVGALWNKKDLIASVKPSSTLQLILRKLGHEDLCANPMPSYLQLAQALAKRQLQNSSPA